jgi:DNA-binding transcriptional ArsR family regulator
MNMIDLTERSQDVADYLKVLANASRLLILCELNNGERSVTALEERVGLTQSALSQHLAKLRDSGIVATRREAQTIYYRLADPRAVRLMGTLYDVFCAAGVPRKAKPKR